MHSTISSSLCTDRGEFIYFSSAKSDDIAFDNNNNSVFIMDSFCTTDEDPDL